MERHSNGPTIGRGVRGRAGTKVLIGIAVVFAATITWLQWPSKDTLDGMSDKNGGSEPAMSSDTNDSHSNRAESRPREISAHSFHASSEKSRVVILDEDGNAIAGARVLTGATRFRRVPGPECQLLGVTTEDGIVEFSLAKWPAEGAFVSAHHPEFVSACVERPTSEGELRVTLSRGHTFTFDCRSLGVPLAGVSIRVTQAVLNLSERSQWVGAPPEVGDVRGIAGRLSVYGAVTDERGKAVIRGLPTGTYGIHAWRRGFVQMEPQIDFGAPSEIEIKVEMLEPIVYAIEYDGSDVLGSRWVMPTLKPVTKPMPECARLGREVMANFQNSACIVLPMAGSMAIPKLPIHILHTRGCNSVEVEGVRASEFSSPTREKFGLTAKAGQTGSALFEFTLRDGTSFELEHFALTFTVPRTEMRPRSMPSSIAIDSSAIPQQLPVGKYTIGAPPGGDFAFLGRHGFEILPGETTKVRVHMKRLVRSVRVEPDFADQSKDVPCHLQVLSSTDPSSVIPGLPTTILASVGSDLTLKGLASGYLGSEVRIKITEGVSPLIVKLPMQESP